MFAEQPLHVHLDCTNHNGGRPHTAYPYHIYNLCYDIFVDSSRQTLEAA